MYGKQADLEKSGSSYIYKTFRIESQLGSGGSGAVYKAWHTRLRKYIVIKVTDGCSPGAAEARRNEVEALKKIKNPRIPQVYDFLIVKNSCFTVMEYIEGISFDKLLEKGTQFTEQQIIQWYSSLAHLLEVIHADGVFHRDIKPANLMKTPDGDICLIDFNAALVSGNGARVVSRSPGYASPEQLEHYRSYISSCKGVTAAYKDNAETELYSGDCVTELTPQYGALCKPISDDVNWGRSDIFSLGATMYHFLTGKHPPAQIEEITPILNLGKYNDGLVCIIARSMRFDPTKRFTTAKQLNEVLSKINHA